MPSHSLTNSEIQKYYHKEPRFKGVCSRYNLPKTMKDRVYVINLSEDADVGTHLIALYFRNIEITYFDIFWSWTCS